MDARRSLTDRWLGWDRAYREGRPPWETGRPQPAFEAAVASARSPLLDAGCGTGENALAFAARGFEVVGVDVAASAVAKAQRKAAARGLEATFLVADALSLDRLGRRFRTIIDSQLFQTFGRAEVASYVASLHAALHPGGLLLLMCFSDREPGSYGPRRVTQAELRAAFVDGWQIRSLEPATFETSLPSGDAQAWFARIVRLPD